MSVFCTMTAVDSVFRIMKRRKCRPIGFFDRPSACVPENATRLSRRSCRALLLQLESHMRPDWSRLSQAERDASYDNNRAVANSAVLIEQRNAASAAFRQAHADHLDVPYGR